MEQRGNREDISAQMTTFTATQRCYKRLWKRSFGVAYRYCFQHSTWDDMGSKVIRESHRGAHHKRTRYCRSKCSKPATMAATISRINPDSQV